MSEDVHPWKSREQDALNISIGRCTSMDMRRAGCTVHEHAKCTTDSLWTSTAQDALTLAEHSWGKYTVSQYSEHKIYSLRKLTLDARLAEFKTPDRLSRAFHDVTSAAPSVAITCYRQKWAEVQELNQHLMLKQSSCRKIKTSLLDFRRKFYEAEMRAARKCFW